VQHHWDILARHLQSQACWHAFMGLFIMNLLHELQVATELARQAGQIALDLRQRLITTYKPAGQGPVTNVDHAVDDFICSGLKKAFPDDGIISEESFVDEGAPLGNGRVWFVDPIDGTTALVAGTDDFVIMIGLAIDGVARVGVVYQPTADILWRGLACEQRLAERIEKGGTKPIAAMLKDPPQANLTIIASISHKSLRQAAMIQALKPKNIMYRSSIGLKAMLILDGEADFYVAWSKKIKLWDTCAPAAITAASGGYISGINEQPLQFSGAIDHGQPIMIARFTPDEQFLSLLATV
jgi:3'(2'), 5'-bisphosphate nucleotidase